MATSTLEVAPSQPSSPAAAAAAAAGIPQDPVNSAKHRNKQTDAVIDFIGGIAGGTASVYTGQPLDTVKVKLQTFPGSYRHALHCFAVTLRDEGIPRGLYAGTVPSLTAQVTENAVLFMAYGVCQKVIGWLSGRDHQKLGIPYQAAAGSMASIFSCMVICPTELVKCRMQTLEQVRNMSNAAEKLGNSSGNKMAAGVASDMKAPGMKPPANMPVLDFETIPKHRIGPFELTRRIMKQEGIPGFYRGFISTLYRDVPSYFFFFGTYEFICEILTPAGKTGEELGAARTIFAGGMGGVASWLIGYPFDVVKSRLQVKVLGQQTSTVGLAVLIARTEGILALYKGLGPTLLRTFPATGALFLAYETTKKLLSRAVYGDPDPS